MKRKFIALLLPVIGSSFLIGCANKTPTDSSEEVTGSGLSGALEYARNHSVGVEGKVYTIYDGTDEKVDIASFDLHNIFDETIISSEIVYHYDMGSDSFDETKAVTYFAKDDGYTYRRGLTVQNEVIDEEVLNSKGEKIKFADSFSSPLKSLEYSHFVKLGDDFLLKPQYSKAFAMTLTQQTISAKKVLFTIENGKFSTITISCDSTSGVVAGLYSSYRFELNFIWDEKGEIPDIKAFEHKDEHDALELALHNLKRTLKNADSYTALSSLSTTSGKGATHYYVTDGAVYNDAADSYGNTYGARKIGQYYMEYVCKFASDGTYTITTYDEDSISEDELLGDWEGFAPEFFDKKEGSNTFVSKEGIAQNIVSFIVPYLEKDYYVIFANEIRINLNNRDAFQSVEIDFNDYQNGISGTTTITYENIGETTLPIELD